MGKAKGQAEAGLLRREGAARAAGMAATAVAAVVAVVMAVRPVNSPDIGYHLAYGEHFLRTGEIVQSNHPFLYVQFDADFLADRRNLGPGCEYDPATNTYRFVNANWLSQVLMAAAYRAGGMNALVVLQAVLMAVVVGVLVVTMRRLGAGWPWMAVPIFLCVLAVDIHIPLRPEVFALPVLLGQWCLLAGPGFGPKRAAGVAGLQVLAANLHSYFLLGVALAGAMLLGELANLYWTRKEPEEHGPTRQRALWLSVALAGTLAACFVNPWFARGAVMPVQTALYMRAHEIGRAGSTHPWGMIHELQSPFKGGFSRAVGGSADVAAYVACLALAGFGAIAGLNRGRLGWALTMAGMVLVSIRFRRNMGHAAMILAPLGTALLAEWWRRKRARIQWAPILELVAAGAAGLVGLWWTVSVVTNHYYVSRHRAARFALGTCRRMLPLDAAEWINTHDPPGRIYCNYDLSSSVQFLTGREVPILTNTWSYPPYWMLQTALWGAGKRPFDPMVRQYDVATVVLSARAQTTPLKEPPLWYLLAGDRRWAVVHVGVGTVIFVRRDGPAGALARQEIRPESFAVERYAEFLTAGELDPAQMLRIGATTLREIGWGRQVLPLWRAGARRHGEDADVQVGLALLLTGRADLTHRAMEDAEQHRQTARALRLRKEALAQWREAGEAFRRVVRLRPDDPEAAEKLPIIEHRIRGLSSPGG